MLENHESKLKSLLEAILLAAGKPLNEEQILNLFLEEERPSVEVLRSALEELGTEYTDRGIELVRVSSGYRLQVKQEWATWVSRLWDEKPQKYSRALLETLALIAYRQPITRGEIEDIRGVAVSTSIIKTLQEDREWIRVVGYKEVPGRPALFASTKTFLDYFGLKSLKDLPALPDVLNLDEVTQGLESLQSLPPEENGETPETVEAAEVAVEPAEMNEEDSEALEKEASEASMGRKLKEIFEAEQQETKAHESEVNAQKAVELSDG